jgi:hypothetical protein
MGTCTFNGTNTIISQHGVTWTISGQKTCGQFINGDWWVVGPFSFVSIAPSFDGKNHGWEVNPPGAKDGQGWTHQQFDSRVSDYVNPISLSSYVAKAGDSIVKAVSANVGSATCMPCLKSASVLTVLGAVPDDNGATVFRPPYIGVVKPLISVNTLAGTISLLPSNPRANIPSASTDVTLEGVRQQFRGVNLVYKAGEGGSAINPADFIDFYGGDKTRKLNSAILRLMLDETLQQKMPALVNVLQYGIDTTYVYKNTGNAWLVNQKGFSPNVRALLALTATLLNMSDMKAELTKPAAGKNFGEDNFIYRGRNGMALWGTDEGAYGGKYSASFGREVDAYWLAQVDSNVGKALRDPYGFIDGGPGGSGGDYFNIHEPSLKGSALIGILMPALKTAWNPSELQELIDFADRYNGYSPVLGGMWKSPDPCAPVSQGGGPLGPWFEGYGCILDPDLVPGSTMNNFSCQAGKSCGRSPESHGLIATRSNSSSSFQDQMWNILRR